MWLHLLSLASSGPGLALSFNEAKLAELRREEGSAEYRERSGRMEKWRQVAMEAAIDQPSKELIPDRIEHLG